MKKVMYLLAIVISTVSCSNNDREMHALIKEKVETMSGHETVSDLLIENGGDYEQLGRIFNCSIHTIKRVQNKETYFSDNAIAEFRELLIAVEIYGDDVFKENDPYYDSWIRSFQYWLKSIVWYVVVISILGAVIGFFGLGGLGLIPLGVYLLILFLFKGLNSLFSFETPANLFLEQINPLFETML